MNIKEKIYHELKNPDFPDLEFLYSQEVLESAEEVLEELLEAEKKDFYEKLKIKNQEITFEIFQDVSLLDYFFSLLEHYQGVNNDEKIREIIENFEPKYIDFGNEIAYSKRYYEMLKYCYKNLVSTQNLTSESPLLTGEGDTNTVASSYLGEDGGELKYNEQKRILEKALEAYEVRGIALPEEQQDRLKEITLRLSELSQKFSNNVLDDRAQFEYIIEDESSISEMPEDDKNIAREKAKIKNKSGYIFDASQSSYSAIMKYCSDSSVRKHFYEARNRFGSEGRYNNRPHILKILKLREEKAHILGFKNYGELSLRFKMAESPEQVIELFTDIAKKARPKAEQELREIQEHFGLKNLSLWDLSYYARKLREEKYTLDDRELKKYFVFENVLAGMFETIKRLYGIEMREIETSIYDKNLQVYEVYKDGKFLSYFFTDYFYRPLKRQGAWADLLREKVVPVPGSTGTKYKKIVVNVCNFQKNTDGPTLLTLGDVETMYHEFGHAIHEMLSKSQYSELSGFHVEWDFVELPSQLLENWCRDPQGMELFAQHFETGDMIPDAMLEKLRQLETFGNGQMILKQNEYAMMDMQLHTENIPTTQEELDERIYTNYDLNALFPRSDIYAPHTSFSHIFDGGYAAGYYSYMWAEIIEKEVWKAFKDAGDIFDAALAEKFHDFILSAGTTKKASELFRDFIVRDPEIDAFLEEKGILKIK